MLIQIDLVLVGFGNVARRFVRLIDEHADALARDHGLAARVVAIATRRHGCAIDARGLDTADALARVERGAVLEEAHAPAHGAPPRDALATIVGCAALAAARPTLMVETTTLDVQRGEPAASHLRAAFAAGMHVITANKGPIACAYHALRDEATRRHLQFFFEGTVMDGIPVFNLVRETLPAVTITGVRGVVNSTTNYVLEAMEGGRPLAAALEDMQRAGIAEADASLDVDGWDAAAKTAALVNVLMGGALTPVEVDRTGIGQLTPADLRAARTRGGRIKLVASARTIDGRVAARVAPEELPATDLLARLSGMANAIIFETDLLGEVAVTQEHGGLTQTAYALVTDLVAVRRRLRAPHSAAALRRNL